jgi:hypothetical protein
MTASSRDGAVGVVNGYALGDRGVGVRVPIGSRIFSSSRRPERFSAHPASYSTGTGVMRSGRQSDHSLPTIAEVKKTWIYIATPPYTFMV